MRAAMLIAAVLLLAQPAAAEPSERARRVIHVTSSITILDDVAFAEGHTAIPSELAPVLDAVAATIRANPDLRVVEIQGFADDRGSARRNVALSLRRAFVVRDYLLARGVEHWRLRATGYGKTTDRKRAVEFVIVARR